MTLSFSAHQSNSEPTQVVAPKPQSVSAPSTERSTRANQYPAKCAECGERVAANQGVLSVKRSSGGNYQVFHNSCATPNKPIASPVLVSHIDPDLSMPLPVCVWPGIYTVVVDDDRRTFRVEVQAGDADFAPGETILSYLAGRDNEGDYKGFAFIKQQKLVPWKAYRGNKHSTLIKAAKVLVADPESALEAKHCFRCNRLLTTPESIARGWGPECFKKGS